MIGILVPLLISAGRLLSAVTRGVAMTFAWPFCSPAEIMALICAVPKTPVVNPIAVFAILENRSLLIDGFGRLAGGGISVVLLWKGSATKPATSGAVEKCCELDADVAAEISLGDDDACLDLDLRLGLVKIRDKLFDGVQILPDVGYDKRVRPLIDLDRTATRQAFLDDAQKAAIGTAGKTRIPA